MDLPMLKGISFGDSTIQNLKPFTKANLPSLKYIHSNMMIFP